MTKIQWFKVTEDVPAQFEYKGRIFDSMIDKGSELETGRHPQQILLPNGDVKWGMTTIPSTKLKKIRG